MNKAILSHDRDLSAWYAKVAQGEIKLPRFQRSEAWDAGRISGLFSVIANNLPVGITLILHVNDPQFIDRYLETAPATGNRVSEHLLDGQQRLTAFWRAVHNNYEEVTYYVKLPELSPEGDDKEEQAIGAFKYRYYKGNKRYPLWADDPQKVLAKGLIPCNLLKPVDISKEIEVWINNALIDVHPDDKDPDFASKIRRYHEKRDTIKTHITRLRETVSHFNLPYLALPATTPKTTALDVFRLMNTNSKPLTLYDVIVSEVEAAAGLSLHDLQKDLTLKVRRIEAYVNLDELILEVGALLQDKIHSMKGQVEMDKRLLVDDNQWAMLVRGIQLLVEFLESQRIYDDKRLPSYTELPVIAALYAYIPEKGDARGNAEIVLQRYIWHSFFSDRYEYSTTSRAFQDFKALKSIFLGALKEDGSPYTLADVPIFSGQHPIYPPEVLKQTKWPKGASVLGRGILAVANMLGARDFADGMEVTPESLLTREYHHIYPYALLTEAKIDSDLALNCALISNAANRAIGRKDPLTYIQQRYTKNATEEIVRQRLSSHLIPIELLKKRKYDALSEEDFMKFLREDFDAFLDRRAEFVYRAVQNLVQGHDITADRIMEIAVD